MEVTFHGQSTVRLRGRDATVLVDPSSGANGKSMPTLVVLTTAAMDWELLRPGDGRPQRVAGAGEFEIQSVSVAGIPVGESTLMRIDIDDTRVVALGPLKRQLTENEVDELGHVEVLLVPVGGGDALNATEATKLVNAVEPSYVVPVRYRDSVLDTYEPVDKFAKEMGLPDGWTAQPKLTILGSSSAMDETRVVILEPRPL